MTTITFKRSGGFVGLGMKYELNLHHLPSDDARKLIHLIEKAEFSTSREILLQNSCQMNISTLLQ